MSAGAAKVSAFRPHKKQRLEFTRAAWPPFVLMNMQNHFELFGLPMRFAIDQAALDEAYRDLQNRVHPDKFASAGDAERRVALQWATRANEAYQTLRNPLKRAVYLCERRGADLQTESNTAMPAVFLMQQMEWREALDEAKDSVDVAALEKLEQECAEVRAHALAQIGRLLDESNELAEAARQVRQLMFLEKFNDDIAAAFELMNV
jgi:molecular chaperone HscB